MAHQRWIVVGRTRGTGENLRYIADYRWRWVADLASDFYALFFGLDCEVKNMWRP